MRFLRNRFAIQLSSFMDDLISQAETSQKAVFEIHVICLVFMCCGWSINWEKTQLIPTQTPLHLGFDFDSVGMTIKVTDQKIENMQKLVKGLLKSGFTSQQNLESL